MIQRIQTVYLILGALAVLGLGLFDAPWNGSAATQFTWYVPSIITLMVVTAGGAVGAVFLYGRRPFQRKVVVGVQVMTVCLAGVLYGGLYTTGELIIRGQTGVLWSKTVMLLLPMVAYVLFLLARRGIESDIELVASMDRIR